MSPVRDAPYPTALVLDVRTSAHLFLYFTSFHVQARYALIASLNLRDHELLVCAEKGERRERKEEKKKYVRNRRKLRQMSVAILDKIALKGSKPIHCKWKIMRAARIW